MTGMGFDGQAASPGTRGRRDGGGRQPVIWVGLDVGGTNLRLLAEDPGGRRTPLLNAPVPAPPDRGEPGDAAYHAFLATVDKLIGEAGVAGRVAGLGAGLPGTVDGARPAWVPNLPYLDGRPLAADLATRVGAAHVELGNDAQLALLGEAEEGAARGCRAALLVAVGTGIGGAIMAGGRIVRGARGSAGAFGWLPAGGTAATPDQGAFELAASGRALDRLAGPGGSRALVAAARAGDPEAVATVAAYGRALGTGIAALASILDPEVVLLGGGLSEAADVLAEPIAAAAAEAASPNGRRVPLRPAALGAAAGAVGALHAARRRRGVWL
jgi:glucokinase